MLMGEGHACEVEKYGVSWLGPYFITKETVDPKGTIAWFPKRLPSHLGLPKAWDSDRIGCRKAVAFGRTTASGTATRSSFSFRITLSHHKAAVSFVEPAANSIAPRERKAAAVKGCPSPTTAAGTAFASPRTFTIAHAHHQNLQPVLHPDLFGAARHRYSHVFLSIKFFESGIKACFRDQLAGTQDEGAENVGEAPCVIGEIGIPIDLENGKAFWTGDYSMQTRALDANLCGLEGNPGLNYTLWTYVPDNSNEWGDGWNSEDLSLWSPPKTDGGSVADGEDLDAGARGIKAFVRPAPVLVPGEIRFTAFDLATSTGYLSRLAGAVASTPAAAVHAVALGACPRDVEIYLPRLHFPEFANLQVHVGSVPRDPLDADATGSAGTPAETAAFRIDLTAQRLWYRCPCARRHVAETPVGSGESARVKAPDENAEPAQVEHRIVVRYGGGRGKRLAVVAREGAVVAAAAAMAEERESAWAVLMAARNFRWRHLVPVLFNKREEE
ncbi:hypothetical protein DFJ73DRAFT_908994 [Zopfochytrium polystomum]|nr:hypothetical protein DFJ73DRAFT_908994 [Zopfochytrium polystomum]